MVERGEAAKRLANDLARLEERATRAGDRLERLSRVSRDEARPAARAASSTRQGAGTASPQTSATDDAPPMVRALPGLR